MNNSTVPKDFRTPYLTFLTDVKMLLNKKLSIDDLVPKEETQKLINNVIGMLSTDEACEKIIEEIEQIEDVREFEAVKFLIDEMNIFHNAILHVQNNPSPELETVNLGLAQASTVKNSITNVISLPKWLQKALHVLNELLSLVKGP